MTKDRPGPAYLSGNEPQRCLFAAAMREHRVGNGAQLVNLLRGDRVEQHRPNALDMARGRRAQYIEPSVGECCEIAALVGFASPSLDPAGLFKAAGGMRELALRGSRDESEVGHAQSSLW